MTRSLDVLRCPPCRYATVISTNYKQFIFLFHLFVFFFCTKYRSEATDTRMMSSPMRTFSPSDLCLEAGCIVHQHDSPF